MSFLNHIFGRTGSVFCAEFQAVYDWWNDNGSIPSDSEAAIWNTWVKNMVDSGLWDKCDLIYKTDVHTNDNGEAQIMWKDPGGSHDLTLYNAPRFESYHGFWPSINGRLETNFIPNVDAVNYTLYDAHCSFFHEGNHQLNNTYTVYTANNIRLYVSFNHSGIQGWRLNNPTPITEPSKSQLRGCWVSNRSVWNENQLYHNNVQFGGDGQFADALPNGELWYSYYNRAFNRLLTIGSNLSYDERSFMASYFKDSIIKESSIPTTNLWGFYEASDSNNFTLTGDLVDSWLDLSGNKRHLVAFDNSRRPTYDSINGRVTFDGAIGTCIRRLESLAPPFTFYLAIHITNHDTNHYIFGKQQYWGGRQALHRYTNQVFLWGTTSAITPNFQQPDQMNIIVGVHDDVNGYLKVDSCGIATGSTGSQTYPDIALGVYDVNAGFDGHVYELIIYNIEHTEEQRNKIYNYLMDKYSVLD